MYISRSMNSSDHQTNSFIQHPCRWMEKFSSKGELQDRRGTPWDWAIWRGASPLGIIPGTDFDKNWYLPFCLLFTKHLVCITYLIIALLIIFVLSYSKRDDVLQTSFSPSGFPWYGQRRWYVLSTWELVLFLYSGHCMTKSLISLPLNRSYGRLQSSWHVIWWFTTIDSMQSYSWHEIHICCVMPAIWYPETFWWSACTGYSQIDDNVSLDYDQSSAWSFFHMYYYIQDVLR